MSDKLKLRFKKIEKTRPIVKNKVAINAFSLLIRDAPRKTIIEMKKYIAL